MASKNVTIRAGERHDVPDALALVKELAKFVKHPHAVLVSQEEMHDAGFGPNKLFDFFVALDENQTMVGFALYFDYYSTWNGRCVYLEDLYVKAEHRKSGIGGRLFDAVVRVAHQRGETIEMANAGME